MKMLSGFSRKVASVLVLALLFVFLAPQNGFASNNDAKFDSYGNMNSSDTAKYVVPNLYRQDSVYTYVKSFPLVVSGGVEYVPISVFSLFDYISVTYSKLSDNFYLINNNNNHYISFDVSGDIADTYDGELMKLPTKIFYQTRYIPARDVAAILGMTVETYDDSSAGVYAVRVRDSSASLSLDKLMDRYLVKKKDNPSQAPFDSDDEDFKNSQSQSSKPQTSTNPSSPTVTPNQPATSTPTTNPVTPPQNQTAPTVEDPIEKVAGRRACMVFENSGSDYTKNLLGVLENYRIKACFSVDSDGILSYPDQIRRMLVDGHTIAVSASANTDGTPTEIAKSFVENLDKANKALKTVTKVTTRLCTIPDSIPQTVSTTQEFLTAVKSAGYIVITYGLDAGDYGSVRSSAVYNRVNNGIVNAFAQNVSGDIVIKLRVGSRTSYYTEEISKFINKYRQFTSKAVNETM